MNPEHGPEDQSDSGAAPQPEKASRAAPQPESPRLGIIHLLGWTACVAAYWGIRRWLALLRGLEPKVTLPLSPRFLEACVWSFCDATALGGLALLVARRLRRLPFPRYPGETWFVILGVMVVIELARYHIISIVSVFTQITYPTAILPYHLPWEALLALLFLVATIRTKSLRWRLCFGSYLGALAVLVTRDAMICLSFDRVPDNRAAAIMAAAGSACLVVAAVKDALDRHRTDYPWTHWTGVVLALLKLAWVVRGLVLHRLLP
jgi:hypothetical protein